VLSPRGWNALHEVATSFARMEQVGATHSIETIGTRNLVVATEVFPEGVRKHYISNDGHTALIDVIPRGDSSDDATALMIALRELDAATTAGIAGATLTVGGLSAYTFDYQRATRNALRWVVLAASLASFIALLVVFRAPLIALKAVLLNLLVVAASIGAMVVVFQDGIGASALGHTSGSILPSVPLVVFTALFGISMDYEVFLLREVQAARQSGGGELDVVASGSARSAALITRAAALMVAVFVSFAFAELLPLSMIGFALVVAIVVDATMVRIVLAPALLAIGARWNWLR
jgi:RND superfamily putative drug exporter